MQITNVKFEYGAAFGIGVASPRISWRHADAPPAWRQTAYEIEIDGVPFGRVDSPEQIFVPWPGALLASRQGASVRVRAFGSDGTTTDWSEPATLEAGLLSPTDWQARFITPDWDEDPEPMRRSPLLRRAFELREAPASARLYISALGLYEAEINGRVVGDLVMTPGWTSYNHRLKYQVFDVTSHLRAGPNALGAILGEGWYLGRIGFPGAGGRNLYGDRLALLAQLEVTYPDGSKEVITTDESWRAALGPVVSSGIYEGETHDARLELDGWSAPGFDDSSWSGVRLVDRNLSNLIAPEGPPVRRQQPLGPREILTTPSGKTILDFGQNLTGRIRFTVDGPTGAEITLRHAEVLEDGELGVRPLRTAQCTDVYTLRGGGPETWEPRFTFHGFRYAEVTGWPGDVSNADIVAVPIHSDMEPSGWFECSDDLVNRLHENAVWSMKSNFLEVPTDCPQRDERLGWTGDITVFSPSASFLHDASGFLASWLKDLAADQHENGVVPVVIPDVLNMGGKSWNTFSAQAVWSDAAVIVPWVLYQRYGDPGVLEVQYESARKWVDAVEQMAGPGRLWDKGFQLADWLDPSAPPEEPSRAMTDPHLVSTAYFAYVARLLSETAAVLGNADDEARYAALSNEVKAAFQAEFVTPSGRMASDAQTAYAVALMLDLLDTDEQRARAGRRLASLVRHNKYRVGTGFVGTALVADALCLVGEEDLAFKMLTERSGPSWLYPVTMGATTVWERWDSMLPDGSINSGQMTSFNHYALGAIADWLHRRVGGLAPLEPGYRRIEIAPLVGGGITWAASRHETPYGAASSSWRIHDGEFELEATIPTGTTARIAPPGVAPFETESGEHRWSWPTAV